jgi:hypothetical protein
MSPNVEEGVVDVLEEAAHVEKVVLDRRAVGVGGIISIITHVDSRLQGQGIIALDSIGSLGVEEQPEQASPSDGFDILRVLFFVVLA